MSRAPTLRAPTPASAKRASSAALSPARTLPSMMPMVAGTVIPALPTRPVDSTGAGDAFAAGYLVGGIALGLEAAARAVATMGAMP